MYFDSYAHEIIRDIFVCAAEDGHIISLDNGIMSIIPSMIPKHLQRIDDVLARTTKMHAVNKVASNVTQVTAMLKRFLSYDMKEEEELLIQQGFLDFCTRVANAKIEDIMQYFKPLGNLTVFFPSLFFHLTYYLD